MDALLAENARLRERIADLEKQQGTGGSPATASVEQVKAIADDEMKHGNDDKDGGALRLPYTTHELTNEQIYRYGRQLILADVGVQKQSQWLRKSALVVGAGGLGAPLCLYLAAAGVGRIGIIDADDVEVTNLQRQVIHTESKVGTSKAISAKDAILRLNSSIQVDAYVERFDESNALALAAKYDVVVDATDNVASRYLINDAAIMNKKAVVSGSALRLEGQCTVYGYNGGPCYRCLYPQPPPAATVTNCSDGGVLGVVTGVIGSIQALEVLKVLAEGDQTTADTPTGGGVGGDGLETLAQKLLLFDAVTTSFRCVKLRPRNSKCAVCGDVPTITKLVNYTEFCGNGLFEGEKKIGTISKKVESAGIQDLQKNISVSTLSAAGKSSKLFVLLDVREPVQYQICSLPGAHNFPLRKMAAAGPEAVAHIAALCRIPLDIAMVKDAAAPSSIMPDSAFPVSVYCICRRGVDSMHATNLLRTLMADAGDSRFEVFNVAGGLEAWNRHVDSTFPLY